MNTILSNWFSDVPNWLWVWTVSFGLFVIVFDRGVRQIVAAIQLNTRTVCAASDLRAEQTDRLISAMQWNRERSDEVTAEYSNRVLRAVNGVRS
jgi:hypothetical protein